MSSKKKKKRAIEKSSAKQKQLEESLSTLRGQLARTEKKLTKARDRAERWKTEAKAQRKVASRPVAEPTTVDGSAVPDETWSVVQLRAEARARGLVGMSNKRKAQLLAALS